MIFNLKLDWAEPVTELFLESNKAPNLQTKTWKQPSTGKSLSEALIFASTNPQYDDRLFLESCSIHENPKLRTWAEHIVYRYCL